MKKALFIITVIGFINSTASHAGVKSIEKWGTSPTGEQNYRITCSSGRVAGNYYYRNGEWYSGYGVAGHRGKSLNWLANYKCR